MDVKKAVAAGLVAVSALAFGGCKPKGLLGRGMDAEIAYQDKVQEALKGTGIELPPPGNN